ncbi:hypothetical protein MICA_42 [Micavibrio aeruginosavorus ARL-13]|uniref:Uncharacterized protein n=1 Tax=Micavibrio aeruginosavorus (strain ARL-13) TaxID=856793 RepID=G2KLF4_MICAA|nr:hypothetical protein MICA_42 [Micavibrio aeruginosavorus ARL-13]
MWRFCHIEKLLLFFNVIKQSTHHRHSRESGNPWDFGDAHNGFPLSRE